MAMTYEDYITAISVAFEYPVVDNTSDQPFFDPGPNGWLARAIEYGEQRIYRELDMLGTMYPDTTTTLSIGSRRVTLPTPAVGSFIVVEQIGVGAPGAPVQLLPVSKMFLDNVYPAGGANGVPLVWCPFDQSTIYLGPAPDSTYAMEVVGMIRPTPLSAENPSTILTTYIPDLFLAATCISWAGFQRDFGQQADNPQLAQSWENQYGTLKSSAMVEQFRVAFASQGWSCKLPNNVAMPART